MGRCEGRTAQIVGGNDTSARSGPTRPAANSKPAALSSAPVGWVRARRGVVGRRVSVVLHRQAALRHRHRPAGRRSVVRRRHRGRLPAVPARPGRPAGHHDAGRRRLRPQVRRTRTGGRDDRPRHRAGRRRGAGVPPRPCAARQHPRRPPAVVVRRDQRPARRPGRAEGTIARGVLHARAQRRRPAGAGRAGGRCWAGPRRGRHVLASGDGGQEVAEALALAADSEITAVPTYVIDGRWSIPGAQDPAVFVQVLQRLAARERAG